MAFLSKTGDGRLALFLSPSRSRQRVYNKLRATPHERRAFILQVGTTNIYSAITNLHRYTAGARSHTPPRHKFRAGTYNKRHGRRGTGSDI